MILELKKLVSAALAKIGAPAIDFDVFSTTDLRHGDYAANTALILSKKTGGNPIESAGKIVDEIAKNPPEYLEKIKVAGPGFINFFLSPKFFAGELQKILSVSGRDSYGRNQNLLGKKVIVEYTDPNPFKEFHVGHLMSNTIGEALSRLVEASGAEVKRACYQGDVGIHVAKALWGWQIGGEREWGKAYVLGSRAYEENPEAKATIEIINKKVYEHSDPAINKLYDWGKKESLTKFEEIYQKLGTKFDFYFFESESGPAGKSIVEEHLVTELPLGNSVTKLPVFEKSDGAVVFRGEKFGLHTRVFLTKDSLPTYEAKELGLAKIKTEKWPHDLSIVVTGNEVNDYFRVVLKAMEQIAPDWAGKIRHVSHGMLRLPAPSGVEGPSVKMSSRTGRVIAVEQLIDELKHETREQEAVAVAAIKYSILKQSPGRDIIFDSEKSLSLTGDSGPYLQYTFVRAKSVLAKKGEKEIKAIGAGELNDVVRLLSRFPETIERAAQDYAPQHLVSYLVELASAFNGFYAKEQIIGSAQEAARLALTAAVAQILQNGLWLLGMPAPERM